MRELPCKYVCPAWVTGSREREIASQWIDRLGSSMTWVVQFEGCPFFAEFGAAACRFCARGGEESEDEDASRRTNRAKVTVFHLVSPFKRREGSSLLSPLRPQPPMPHRPLFHVFKGNKNKRPEVMGAERRREKENVKYSKQSENIT